MGFPSPWSPPHRGPGPRLAGLGTSVEKHSPVSMELEQRRPWGQRPLHPWGTRGTQVRPLCPWEEAKGEDILGFPASRPPQDLPSHR